MHPPLQMTKASRRALIPAANAELLTALSMLSGGEDGKTLTASTADFNLQPAAAPLDVLRDQH
jgi:uncharacterized membrane protein